MTEKLEKDPPVEWKDFLENIPPSKKKITVANATNVHGNILRPELRLYCPNCTDFMNFSGAVKSLSGGLGYLTYSCKNCGTGEKIYAIQFDIVEDVVTALKIGEYPAFGPPLSKNIQKFAANDKQLLMSGRQCENQGLGIGAHAYYRRVVEAHWQSLLDNIIDAGKLSNCPASMIETLERAKSQRSFQNAVDDVKDSIPPSLLVNGYNPISLLYKALSIGVHGMSDSDCLATASDIRIILEDLLERIYIIKKEKKELIAAAGRLANLGKPTNT